MFQKLKEKIFTREFLVFGCIGVCNTLIAQGLYILFVKENVSVGLASILGDCLSMVFSYIMNMRFTYRQKMSWKSALTFPLSYLPGIAISAINTVLFVNWLHAPKLWAKLLSLPISVPMNFLCMNVIVKRYGGESLSK